MDAAEISSVHVSQVGLEVRGTIGVHGSRAGVIVGAQALVPHAGLAERRPDMPRPSLACAAGSPKEI